MKNANNTKVWACAILLLLCTAPVFAQDQANEVRCSGSGTTCKSNFLPKFASNGGSATVNDSIISQSGTTINVAGSESLTGSISSSGSVRAGGSISAVGSVTGVFVEGKAGSGTGVEGITSAGTYGVFGENDSATGGKGVFGFSRNGFEGFGVQGYATGSDGIGVGGSTGAFGSVAKSIFGTAPIGVIGDSTNGYAVVATSDNSNALLAVNNGSNDTAVISNLGSGFPLFAAGSGGSMFLDSGGNLHVSGAVTAGSKSFKIDHPLDPANKYLYHTSVESSEMINIYTGMTLLDFSGSAIVSLPDWFEAVNGDFRYQLTAIGAPAPNLHIAREISNNLFMIAGGHPGMKVSWQVTGVRHDAYAKAHPLEVSVEKTEEERGYYIHPELYGATGEKSLASAHMTQIVQRAKQNN
jgi:hypothetical protein